MWWTDDEQAVKNSLCRAISGGSIYVSDKIFKIRNRIGKNGVCVVFNINAENKPVSGRLAPNEIGIPDCDYAYCEYFSKERGWLKRGESLQISLSHNDDFRL